MQRPTNAASSMLRNAPDPLASRMPGTIMKTEEAGVEEERVMSTVPSTSMLRWSSPFATTACAMPLAVREHKLRKPLGIDGLNHAAMLSGHRLGGEHSVDDRFFDAFHGGQKQRVQ